MLKFSLFFCRLREVTTKSFILATHPDDYARLARMETAHYNGGPPPPQMDVNDAISSSNGYLKDHQDDKSCNSSPHTPDDLSSSNKVRMTSSLFFSSLPSCGSFCPFILILERKGTNPSMMNTC